MIGGLRIFRRTELARLIFLPLQADRIRSGFPANGLRRSAAGQYFDKVVMDERRETMMERLKPSVGLRMR